MSSTSLARHIDRDNRRRERIAAGSLIGRYLPVRLRDGMDALQIALAEMQDQLDAVRRERDLWADRARLLATALAQEARGVAGGAARSDPVSVPPTERSHPPTSAAAAA